MTTQAKSEHPPFRKNVLWGVSELAEGAAAQIEQLLETLKTCEAWIDRWTAHVGTCKGGDGCTCGRTAVLFEARRALEPPSQKPAPYSRDCV